MLLDGATSSSAGLLSLSENSNNLSTQLWNWSSPGGLDVKSQSLIKKNNQINKPKQNKIKQQQSPNNFRVCLCFFVVVLEVREILIQ